VPSGGQEAIVAPTGRFSYSDLLSASRNVSGAIRLSGCAPGSRAALFLPNGFGFAQAFFGALHAGAVAVPFNTAHQGGELESTIRQARPHIIITDKDRSPHINAILQSIQVEIRPSVLILEEVAGNTRGGAEETFEDPDRPALLQYSTGSTGLPKPVVRTVRQLAEEADHFRDAVRIGPQDRILGVVPLFHAHGLGNAMLAALLSGATLVVLEGFNPRDVLTLLTHERITVFPGVPFMFKLLAELRYSKPLDLKPLRLCVSAGAALDPETSRAFFGRFGLHVRQLYGSTETGSVTINLDPDIAGTLESVGKPMPPVEVAVFDDSGSFLKTGETGEIGIRSPAMAVEYEGLAEATKEAFRYGFFFPGDLGWLDAEGRLFLSGRKTFFINVGGYKVDPAEVEEVIGRHPAVKDVVVVGVKAPYGGEIVKAIVVAAGPCARADIGDACAGRLAEYKVPQIVEFREEIPKSPLGKVLRKHLV
jgi:long-chain acyl-CoA synthetase